MTHPPCAHALDGWQRLCRLLVIARQPGRGVDHVQPRSYGPGRDYHPCPAACEACPWREQPDEPER